MGLNRRNMPIHHDTHFQFFFFHSHQCLQALLFCLSIECLFFRISQRHTHRNTKAIVMPLSVESVIKGRPITS